MQHDERERPQPAESADDQQAASDFETQPPAAPLDEPLAEPLVEPEPSGPEAVEDSPAPPAYAPPAVEPAPPPGEVEAVESIPAAEDADATAAAAHTVPATGVGESTLCPRCGTENRPGIAFCRTCGQRLIAAGVAATLARPGTPEGTVACPRCGTHNREGVAFCQNCGANLRGVSPTTDAGYVPPAVAAADAEPTAVPVRRRALLGPVVLLIGAFGLTTGWLLPFPFGGDSLFGRAFGPAGYGIGFWNGYGSAGTALAEKAYFGLAAAAPILIALLLVLAIAGVIRAAPGRIQLIGLLVALVWALGLAALFVVVEVLGGPGGGLTDILRALTPGGIILFLASLIVVIGSLTRLGRG